MQDETPAPVLPMTNTASLYGRVTIAFHWLGAATIIVMLYSATMMWLAGEDRAKFLPWVMFHASVGTLLWLVLAGRIVSHFSQIMPAKLSPQPWEHILANFVQNAMLALLALQLISGPLDVWSGGYPLSVFNLFAIPSPWSKPTAWHEGIGAFHGLCGRAVFILLMLHLGGVAKHLLVDRDQTLARMLGRARINP